MLEDQLLVILGLMMTVSLLSMLGEKFKIPYPIFLVICGLFIGFIPNAPEVLLDPDMVFFMFLPPLLFAAAWNTSWKDFWSYRRPISLLAFGLVIFTSFAVAVVSNAMIPGFTLALGFVLGGIISPPDAIAATSILQKIKMPQRVVAILEGESLVNDSSSLIVLRFALVAVITGQFTIWNASLDFVVVASAGILVGLMIAFSIYAIHRFLPTTPSIDTAITLISPFIMYLVAEYFHFSGVLAVVSGGLFLSARAPEIFTFETRIQSKAVWDTVVYMLNGAVFILIGLQLPGILDNFEPGTLPRVIMYGVVISVVIILVRIIWVFPATYLPRMISKKIRENEPYPDWKSVLIVAWSGMRGVISLAAALSIPLTISAGDAFPFRNEILIITFIVILITLVFQGLSLPFIIRKLNIIIEDTSAEQELEIQLHLVNAVIDHIDTHYADEMKSDVAFRMLRERNEHFRLLQKKELQKPTPDVAPVSKYLEALLDLVEVRRKVLATLREEKKYPDELIRNIEKGIDHEEARLSVQIPKEENA